MEEEIEFCDKCNNKLITHEDYESGLCEPCYEYEYTEE